MTDAMSLENEKRYLLLLSSYQLANTGSYPTKARVLDNIENNEWILLSQTDKQKKQNRNELVWRNDLAFTRQHLSLNGWYNSSENNNWSITPEGEKYLKDLHRILSSDPSSLSKVSQKAVDYAKSVFDNGFSEYENFETVDIRGGASTKTNMTKDAFYTWLREIDLSLVQTQSTEKTISTAFERLGIRAGNIYDENDPLKIRLMASELIMKRNQCAVESVRDYINAMQHLILYAEFLEKKPTPNGKKEVAAGRKTLESTDKTKDALTVAYYLSRANKKALQNLGYKSFREAFEGLALILEQKSSTIKNMRDEFDPYFDNGRVGWYQRQLSASRKEVYDYYKDYPDDKVAEDVKRIIDRYSQLLIHSSNNQNQNHNHKKIVISSHNMKEFKAKK